jgi:VIT1/CCC1 family predicted Fe2+/Mn2+ transporter
MNAQQAYTAGNVDASRAAHIGDHDEKHHSVVGGHIKSIVYGGLDGIITTFAVVSGATGGRLDASVILILGISNMFADGGSMGIGAALASRADKEMVLRERDREKWEMENFPEGEIAEMVEIYTDRGLAPDVAETVVRGMATNSEFMVRQMLVDELHLTPPDDDDNPWVEGMITFASFILFGVFPLLAYICLDRTSASEDTMFTISCSLTAVMLFVLGVVKSQFTKQPWYLAGGEILGLGGITAGISYGIGALVAEVV